MKKLTNLLFEGYNYKRINDINVDPNTQKMIVYHITGKHYNSSSWSANVPKSEKKPERYRGEDKAERSKNILDRLAYKEKKSKARFDRTLKGQTYNLSDAISGGMYSSGNEFGVGTGKHHGPGLYTCYKFNPSIARTYGGKLGATVLQFECSTENMLILNGKLCQMIRGKTMTIGEQMDRIIENKGLQLSSTALEIYNDWKETIASQYDNQVLDTTQPKPRSANIWQDVGRKFAAAFGNSLLGRDIVDSVLLDGAGDGPVVVLFDYKIPQLIRAGYIYKRKGRDAVKWFEDLGQLGSSRFRVPKKDLALSKEISETSEEDLEKEQFRQKKLEDFVASDAEMLSPQEQKEQVEKVNESINQFEKSFVNIAKEYGQSCVDAKSTINLTSKEFIEMCKKLITHEVENELSSYFADCNEALNKVVDFMNYAITNVYVFNRLIGIPSSNFESEMNGNIKFLPIAMKCMQTIANVLRNNGNNASLPTLVSSFYINELEKHRMTVSFNIQQVNQNAGEISSLLDDYYDAPAKMTRMIKNISSIFSRLSSVQTNRNKSGIDDKFLDMFTDTITSSIQKPDFDAHSKYSESISIIRSEYERIIIPKINSTSNLVINSLISFLNCTWPTSKNKDAAKILSSVDTIFTEQEDFENKNTDNYKDTVRHLVNDQFGRNDHSSIYSFSCDFLYEIFPEIETKISFNVYNNEFIYILRAIDKVFQTNLRGITNYELEEFVGLVGYNEKDSKFISSLLKGLSIEKIKETLIKQKTLNYVHLFEWSLESYQVENSPNPALARDLANSIFKFVNDSLSWDNDDVDNLDYSCEGFDLKLLKSIQTVISNWHHGGIVGEL